MMMKPTALAAGVMMLAGCSALSRPNPSRAMFSIDAGPVVGTNGQPITPGNDSIAATFADTTPAANAPTTRPAELRVRVQPVRMAREFDALTFTYRTGDEKYEQDYYSGYIALPSQLLTGEIVRWLNDSGVVKYAISSGSALPTDASMETHVTALYGDYRDAAHPKAVIEARVFVIPIPSGSVTQKLYRESVVLDGTGPDALAKGIGLVTRKMLMSLSRNMQALNVPSGAPANATTQP